MLAHIEDILHLYVDSIGITDSNTPILASISRQCKKGMAMTDRQYELVKAKLLEQATVIQSHIESDIMDCLTPRLPLREIDRSKYICFSTTSEIFENTPYESHKENWVWIKIRFPFAKKLIAKIEKIKSATKSKYYFHRKGTHEHYFKIHGNVVTMLVDEFMNSHFKISDDVYDCYNTTKKINADAENYLIRYSKGHFYNVPDHIVSELNGKDELIKIDRHIRYCYSIDAVPTKNLLESIAYRDKQDFYVDPEEHSFEEVVNVISSLERFPLVVLIDDDASYDQLQKIHTAFPSIENEKQVVLFREEADSKNANVNEYVKANNLNSWVDNTTKIVYIKKKQLPKIMFTSGFVPMTALSLTSLRSNNNVGSYVKFYCDLILLYDKQPSLFNVFGKRYSHGYL